MRKSQDVYGEPEVFHYDNCIVKVYRPILTEAEQARRMERIKRAAADLLLSVERAKANERKELEGE